MVVVLAVVVVVMVVSVSPTFTKQRLLNFLHEAHRHVTNIKEEKYTASVAVVGSRLPYTVAKLH